MPGFTVKVGTYNVNNLFDRFDDPYSSSDDTGGYRTTKPKSLDEIYQLGARFREDRPDVMALQEIEGKGILYEFNVSQLGRHFRDIALIPANDPRNIDCALVSTITLGQIVSYQFIRDYETGHRLFSRDLLEVEVLNPENPNQRLFTIFVSHLKSKYIDPSTKASERDDEQIRSDRKRWKQAAAIAQIVRARFPNPNDYYIVAGDFNDTPDSQTLAPLLHDPYLQLYDILQSIPDPENRWTHYWKEQKLRSQIDYLLLSPGLAQRIVPGSIEVVHNRFVGGSDHRPVYVTLEF